MFVLIQDNFNYFKLLKLYCSALKAQVKTIIQTCHSLAEAIKSFLTDMS